jgi:HEAT repeat protein
MRHYSLRVLFLSCFVGLTAGSGIFLIKPFPSLAVEPEYPLIDYKSYPPVNKVCTDLEVKRLIEQFIQDVSKSNKDNIRTSRLITCGKSAVPALVKLLNSQDENILVSTALSLEYIGLEAKNADSALIPLLKHPSSDVKFRAAFALARIGTKSKAAIRVLIPLLGDSERQVAAAAALGEIGMEAEIAIPELVMAFRNAKFGGETFVEALTKIGDKGIIAIIQLLKDPDIEIHARAASALGRSGIAPKIVVSPLTEALLDRDTVCIRAAESLRNIGESAKKAIPNLIEALRNRASCRRSAGDALASIGKDTVLPLAIILLQNSDRSVRLESAQALRRIGKDAKAAIPALIKVLEGQDTELASYAAETLGLIGSDAKAAIPSLVKALGRQEEDREEDRFIFIFRPSIQNIATSALGQMGKDAVPDLIALILGSDKATRVRALLAIGQIGSDAKEAIPHLQLLLQSQDDKIQLLAAIALAEIGADADIVLPKLIAALRVESKEVKARVASAIGNLRSSATDAVPDLVRIIGEGSFYFEDWDIRNNATQALIKIGKNAIPSLILALGDRNTVISAKSSFALIKIGSPAISELVAALRNPNIEVRRRAAFILGQIGADAIPALQSALQDEDTNSRKGAIYALGIINQPSTGVISSLKKIVENTKNSLDERRIAASTLELMGQNTSWFFKQNNLVSPLNAACIEGEFDSYIGKCLTSYSEGVFVSGGGSLIGALCSFFGCN